MIRPRISQYLAGVLIASVAFGLTLIFSDAFRSMDEGLLPLKYRVRGEVQIDSSIVILYLDNDAIAALGDLPLKRSYYALLFDVLHQLGAKVVGVDIAFTDHDDTQADYDQLLTSVVQRSGNVVLGSYFRSHTSDTIERLLPDRFKYPVAGDFQKGRNLELPFTELLASAVAIGHTNLTDGSRMPLFVSYETAGKQACLVPALPLEVWRVASGFGKHDFKFARDELSVTNGHQAFNIPFNADGEVTLNYTGGLQSLRSFPIVRFLQSYDVMISGGEPALPIREVKDKVVLIGVIAEGRSSFVETPFAKQFPSIALHATFIHDLLNNTFLSELHSLGVVALPLIVLLISIVLMTSVRDSFGLGGVLLLMLLLIVLSFLLFVNNSLLLPVTPSIFVAGCVAAGMLVYKHRIMRSQVDTLSTEKDTIERALKERETRLARIETEVSRAAEDHHNSETSKLLVEVQRYREEISKLRSQSEDLHPFVPAEDTTGGERAELHGIIHLAGGPMADVVTFLKKIADNNATVLLLGESGTGKELVARALHLESARRSAPFIAVNCGALTETLLESELFGHEKGSFTGATREKPGRFELAHGGSIFLDEIAETSEAFQVKLLRVLQEGTFERVGGTETRKVDVRVIAATNRDLKQWVGEKKFREDLYYRLNVLSIQLPPLRDRRADIPVLMRSFVEAESPAMECSASVVKVLQQHDWKGNIRELQSVVKRAALLARAEGRVLLRIKDLPTELAALADLSLDIEERIVHSLREKKFSRSAMSETADDLGGLNRGTIAEYFRGFCFSTFLQQRFDFDAAAGAIAGDSDEAARKRVSKKLSEYLSNATELVDRSKPLEFSIGVSRQKCKNLPQRYHSSFDQIIESYHSSIWSLPPDS